MIAPTPTDKIVNLNWCQPLQLMISLTQTDDVSLSNNWCQPIKLMMSPTQIDVNHSN